MISTGVRAMALDKKQRQIVAHFASFLPLAKRPAFEIQVLRDLKGRHDRTGQRAVRACVDAIMTLGKVIMVV